MVTQADLKLEAVLLPRPPHSENKHLILMWFIVLALLELTRESGVSVQLNLFACL